MNSCLEAEKRIEELENELRMARVDEAFHKLTVSQRDRAWRESAARLHRIGVLEQGLEQIAIGKRSDGSYNRSREACEELARKTLDDQTHLLRS